MKLRKMSAPLIVAAILGMFSAGFAGPGINSVAPAFSKKDSAGVNHSLADFKGKVVLINFWGTW